MVIGKQSQNCHVTINIALLFLSFTKGIKLTGFVLSELPSELLCYYETRIDRTSEINMFVMICMNKKWTKMGKNGKTSRQCLLTR